MSDKNPSQNSKVINLGFAPQKRRKRDLFIESNANFNLLSVATNFSLSLSHC